MFTQGSSISQPSTTLNRSHQNLGPEGAKILGKELRVLDLKRILFDWNNIGPRGTRYIAKALKFKPRLTYLSLCSNNLGPEGARFLGESLAHLPNLNTLSLDSNHIGFAVWFITAGLSRRTAEIDSASSFQLSLSDNLLDSRCLHTLAKHLCFHRDNTTVYLHRNFIDEESLSKLTRWNVFAHAQQQPSRKQQSQMDLIREWVLKFSEVQLELKLEQSRESDEFWEIEKDFWGGGDSFEKLAEGLGGDLSSFNYVLTRHRSLPTPESLALVYAHIGDLWLSLPEQTAMLEMSLASFAFSLV